MSDNEGSNLEPAMQLHPQQLENAQTEAQQLHHQEQVEEDDGVELGSANHAQQCESPGELKKGDDTNSIVDSVEVAVALKVIYNKRKIDLNFPTSEKVIALKRRLQEVTGIPVDMQKLMFRGLCQDDRVLSELGVGHGAKLMLVGSTPDSLASVRRTTTEDEAAKSKTASTASTTAATADAAVGGGRLSQRESHKRVLDKYGRPDDLMPGSMDSHMPLPVSPLRGMYNKQGAKVRLTFKLEIDELWIGTKERTNKIHMSSIKRIVSDPIEGQETYHIMGLQLGPTEASMYWVYWVPCQYVRAIKNTVGT